MIKGHGGNIYSHAKRLACHPSDIIDMSSNVNPIGPPGGLLSFLKDNLKDISALPEVDADANIRAFAKHYNIDPSNVLAGNGTTEFIYLIPTAFDTKKAVIVGPTYSDYADACSIENMDVSFCLSDKKNLFQPNPEIIKKSIGGYDTVFICNPNNPTGNLLSANDIEQLSREYPDTAFIIDESYLSFARNSAEESMMTRGLGNVIVLYSMSKIFRIPGLRSGFVIGSDERIEQFKKVSRPWSVNSLAQTATHYILKNSSMMESFIEQTVNVVETEKGFIQHELSAVSGIKLYDSCTSFILIELPKGIRGDYVYRKLLDKKILIRNCSNFQGLTDQFIRVSVKDHENNRMFVESFLSIVS